MKKLVIIMDEKNPDAKHICNEKHCPFYGKNKICDILWSTNPQGKSKLSSLCNYYNVQDIVIAEVEDYVKIKDIH